LVLPELGIGVVPATLVWWAARKREIDLFWWEVPLTDLEVRLVMVCIDPRSGNAMKTLKNDDINL
jgi:hypothetical protein